MSRYEIAIIGAGPVGLSLAGLLATGPASDAIKVRIFDAGRRRRWDPATVDLRVYALSRAAEHVLDAAGAWSAIRQSRISAYERMKVWEGPRAQDAGLLCFDSAEVGEPNLGHIVEDRLIREKLIDALAGYANVEIEFDRQLEHVSSGDRRVRLKFAGTASPLAAHLLIGADGARSQVRDFADIDVLTRDYRQQAIVAHVVPERSHERTAWQRFLPGGPLALLPLADGRCSIVWSLPQDEAQHLVRTDESDFEHALAHASGGVLGELSVDTPRLALPLVARHAMRYCRSRLALVGDAAHTVHPLAGQGANLGFADAAELAQQISASVTSGQDPGDIRVLRRYERARSGPNMLMIGALDCLERWFCGPTVLAPIRSAGLSIVDRLPMLKRRFIEHAAGRSAHFR
jgi:2-octaprenylphenol hydroxylase